MKVKGITSGTYLEKRVKVKNMKLPKREICTKCKYQDYCKYKSISKFNNGKVFENNVKCEYFYFTIVAKAILTIGRDKTTIFCPFSREFKIIWKNPKVMNYAIFQ